MTRTTASGWSIRILAASTRASGRALSSRSSRNLRVCVALAVGWAIKHVDEAARGLVVACSPVCGDRCAAAWKPSGSVRAQSEGLLVDHQAIDLGWLLRFRIGCIEQELQSPGPGDGDRVGHGRHPQTVQAGGARVHTRVASRRAAGKRQRPWSPGSASRRSRTRRT